MAPNPPEILNAARDLLESLDGFSPTEDWLRLERDPQSDEVIARAFLDTSRFLAEQVVDAKGHVLPSNPSRSAQAFRSLQNQAETIKSFSLTEDDRNSFTNLSNAIRQETQAVLHELGQWAACHASQRADKPAGRLAEQQREAAGLLRAISADAEAAKNAANEARDEAIQAGAAVFSGRFEDDWKAGIKRSKHWLWASIGSLVAAVAMALWIMLDPPAKELSDWRWLQPLAGKVFVLSLLTYATSWCGRRSLAEHHNASVNRHRSNGLTIVKAIRSSGVEDATKDAIVLEVARSVFEGSSGLMVEMP